MTRGRLARILPPLLAWWLLLSAVAAALAGGKGSMAAMDWAGTDFARVLPLVAIFLTATVIGGFLYSALHAAGHQFLVTRL